MAREQTFYVVTIDGRAYDRIFTTIKGITKEFKELPYSTLREAFKIAAERVFAKDNKLYRISRASVSRVTGRGKHLVAYRAQ